MPSDGGSSNDDGSGNDRSNENAGFGGGDGNDFDSGFGGGWGSWGGPDYGAELDSQWGGQWGTNDNEGYSSWDMNDPGLLTNIDNLMGNPDWGSMATKGLGLAGMALGAPVGLTTFAQTAAGLLSGVDKFAGNVAGRIGGALGNSIGGLPGAEIGQSIGSKIGNWSGENTQNVEVGEYSTPNELSSGQKRSILDKWYTPNRSTVDQLRNFRG